jgi:AcrR family transcriptional regulator
MTNSLNDRNTPLRREVIALKRERVLEAAVDLFYERGYENTTLEAVGDRIEVTKPFIYSYHKSKSDLLTEICERGIRASLDALNEVISLPVSATERLRLLGERFVLAVLRNQKYIAIFSREEKNLAAQDFERISGMRREFDQKLNGLLEEGRESGEFTFEDTRLACLAIGGMVSWVYVWYRPGGRLEAPDVAAGMTDLILRMVGAGGAEKT